ncbi:MAG: PQQ-dependent sugar dehydrogenase [Chitinophagaceae bacterium]|nr:PQQ-dependent sugar dehydrogenase [Chitinophagaceae bacterium]
MKKAFRVILVLPVVSIFIFQSCTSGGNSKDVVSDSLAIANGEAVFNQNCSSCHNFLQDGIGPQLSGITNKVPAEWISNFIHDPKKLIDAGDDRAKKLFDQFHMVMPSFASLGEKKISDIITYIKTVKVEEEPDDGDTNYLKDPIPEKIKMSGMSLQVEELVNFPSSSDEEPRTRITKLGQRPGSEDLYVVDLRGPLYVIKNGKPEVYMNMKSLRKDFINKPGLATGFGSFAFHPDFEKNGLLYTSHTEPKGTAKADFNYADSIPVELQWVVTEWKTGTPDAVPFSGEGRELLRIDMVTGIHGMQELTFNPNAKPGSKDYGKLYIGIGDGGCVENRHPSLVHTPSKAWGSIFRIDPAGNNSTNGKYGIPADNPFAKDTDKVREMYAYGFRNPHRISWTRDGRMLAANIGQRNIESLYLIQPGRDHGWPIREGTFLITPYGNINKARALVSDDKALKITYPVAEYDHDEGKAISGGYEYSGSNIKDLLGKFIFGDINSGRLFFVETKNLVASKQTPIQEFGVVYHGEQSTMQRVCENNRVDMRLGIDHKGEMYLLSKNAGKVYRITGISKQ